MCFHIIVNGKLQRKKTFSLYGPLNDISKAMSWVLRCVLLSSLLSRQSSQICRGVVTNLKNNEKSNGQ